MVRTPTARAPRGRVTVRTPRLESVPLLPKQVQRVDCLSFVRRHWQIPVSQIATTFAAQNADVTSTPVTAPKIEKNP